MSRTKKLTIAAHHDTVLKNYLLAALPVSELRRIEPLLEQVALEPGQLLYEPNKRINYAYFPTTAVVSLLHFMENGSTTYFSLTGNDGVVGVALFMGAETMPNQAIVQCGGEGFKMRYWDLQKEFKHDGMFHKLLLRFTMALMLQTSQTAACNRLHSVEMQFCRWLLLTDDRLETNTINITHDLISNILGVSREGITRAAKKLKRRKLIENLRGAIKITDRQGLETAVCECYKHINNEYNRLLSRGISKTFR